MSMRPLARRAAPAVLCARHRPLLLAQSLAPYCGNFSRPSSTSGASSRPSAGLVLAFADGASRGNPGRSGCGALLRDPDSNQVIATAKEYLGEMETNNSAEYRGLLLALRLAKQHDVTRVHVHMDSQLVVRQMRGEYRVKAANLRILYDQCRLECGQLEEVKFSHVRREENATADGLANEAIDELELSAMQPMRSTRKAV